MEQLVPGDAEQTTEFSLYALIGRISASLDLQERKNLVLRQTYLALSAENAELRKELEVKTGSKAK